MEIDWNGIARSRRIISGGQDESNILALVTDDPVTEEQLNALIPDEDGEFPAEGGWFAGPGGWLLSIEPSEPAKPHIEALVRRLEHAGITGTLTGAKPYGRPAWARPLEVMPSWRVLFSYRPRPEWDRSPGWWSAGPLLEPVIDHAINWATEDDGQLVVNLNLKPGFPFTPEAGKQALRNQAETEYVSSAIGYNKEKRQTRRVRVASPGYVELILLPARTEWAADIDQLRTLAITAPRDKLTSATISHHGWADLNSTEQTHFNWFDYSGHPEIWDEYILNPCGIQILTDKHLTRAHNLDNWNTKQLDDHHYLVQAKDLGPWYSQPLDYYDEPDAELTAKARADFGDMLFTHATAQRLGITKPH